MLLKYKMEVLNSLLRFEFPPGPDPDQTPDFEKHWSLVRYKVSIVRYFAILCILRYANTSV